MKSFYKLIPLLCLLAPSWKGHCQSDLVVGSNYQLNIQRKNGHADAFILHNAQYHSHNDSLTWNTTHSNFGSRGIRFSYSFGSGIHFYADNLPTTAGVTFTPTTRFFIGNNGNVGIGTTSPQSPLHSKAIGTNTLILESTGTGTRYSQLALMDNGSILGYVWLVPQSQVMAIGKGGHEHINMRMDNDFVGIGTTNPDSKLTVKGDIHAREVRVDLAGSIAPDYVFEKDYELLPLTTVEHFINQNKHLPGIPSAKEMENNGLQLKEMNLALLKKVEELTLYVIQLNNRLQTLEIQNEEQRNEIERLKSNAK